MRKFLPLHMYLPLIFTCKAKAPPEMGGAMSCNCQTINTILILKCAKM